MQVNNEVVNATEETVSLEVKQDYSKLLSRKFIIATLAILSATILVACSFIADGVYATVVVATVGAYLTANVTQKKIT